jgi:hypothetical protein
MFVTIHDIKLSSFNVNYWAFIITPYTSTVPIQSVTIFKLKMEGAFPGFLCVCNN